MIDLRAWLLLAAGLAMSAAGQRAIADVKAAPAPAAEQIAFPGAEGFGRFAAAAAAAMSIMSSI